MKKSSIGALLIMLAAALWALDALIRTTLTTTIPSTWIVFIEHFVGLIVLLPFLIRERSVYKTLTVKDWLVAVGLTLVSSVFGTLLFTQALALSFVNFDFATPVLLQKLQPLFTIAVAGLFLRERVSLRYLFLVPGAFIGSYMISFGTEPITFQLAGKELVYVLAIGAAAAWGSGTVLSKSLLNKMNYSAATALRFLLAIPLSLGVALYLDPHYSVMGLQFAELWRFLLIALTTGAGAILIYYRGLRHTTASVSTIAELTFPIVSILIAITYLNPYGEPQHLTLANIFGILILLSSILGIGFDREAVKQHS
ncbi:MAG: DMT family transporter [Patescibacteria group bacterium]|jgi:drug/metabolite transporter (DMT)-like permease